MKKINLFIGCRNTNRLSFCRYLLLLLAVFVGLSGCVTAPSIKENSSIVSRAISLAQFEKIKGQEALKKYFDKLDSSERSISGAFAKDPFGERFKWATRSDIAANVEKIVLDDSRMVLLARNGTLVWEKNLEKYTQSSIGQGRKLFKQKKYREAIEYFLEFSTANPKDWYVFNRIGWAFLHVREYEQSAKYFEKSITLNNKNRWNYYGLARAKYWLREYQSAHEYAQQSLELSKKDNVKKINYLTAMIHIAQGDYQIAADILGNRPVIGVNTDKTSNGFLIKEIFTGSSADLLGLKPGDIITEINDSPVSLSLNISGYFLINDYGKKIPIKIKRGEKEYYGKIFLGVTPSLPDDFIPSLILQRPKKDHKGNKEESYVASSSKSNKATAETNIKNNSNSNSNKIVSTVSGVIVNDSQQWAVIVGISKYQYSGNNGLDNLIFADDDAKAFARSLYNLGWQESHIKLLLNEEATEKNIRIALESWLSKAGPNDQVILFWAGHGFPDPEDPEKVYFATYDTDISIPATGYRMDRVRSALEEVGARNVILLADTCHAGKIITRGNRNRSISIVPQINKMQREKKVPKGWIFMVGADTDRQAIEHTSWKNGAFTHSLVKGINGAADGFHSVAPQDGIVTMRELRTYMNTAMPEETQKILGVAKRPVITTSTGDPSIWDITLQVVP